MVGLLALIHLIVKHPQGRIKGVGGIRYGIACDPERAYIATNTNNECGTGDPAAVNCSGCKAEIEKQKMAAVIGEPVNI
jgi:hypothetical protein